MMQKEVTKRVVNEIETFVKEPSQESLAMIGSIQPIKTPPNGEPMSPNITSMDLLQPL